MSEIDYESLIKEAESNGFRIITRNNPSFEKDKEIWNVRLQTVPTIIAYCNKAEDVQYCLSLNRRLQLPLRVRSGGHHHEGMSCCPNGFIIDVSEMNEIRYYDRYTAWIPPGKQLQDVYAELKKRGKVIPGGGCQTVCVGGLTLGGGWGPYSRALGLTCDNILEVEMVLADGSLIRASKSEHEYLFWAVCGGGAGNFGVVTNFLFKLTDVRSTTDLSNKTTIGSEAKAALNAVLAKIKYQQIPPSETWAYRLFIDEKRQISFSQGGTRIELGQLVTASTQVDAYEFTDSQTPDFINNIATEVSNQPTSTCSERLPHKVSSAFVINDRITDIGDILYRYLEENRVFFPNAATYISFHSFGGEISNIAPDSTAFPYRDRYLLLQFQAWWTDPNDVNTQIYINWIENIRQFLALKNCTDGGFFNFQDAAIVKDNQYALMKYYYGNNLPRLMDVKKKYDPNNIFNSGMSIPIS